MTESEWRKSSNQSQSKKADSQAWNSGNNNPTTTVNPRERPKASVNTVNPILPLINNNTSSNTSNSSSSNIKQPRLGQTKITVSIKPAGSFSSSPSAFISPFQAQTQQPVQEQFGFDDDFGALDSNTPDQLIALMASPTPPPKVATPINVAEKKSHRRSASHSSTIFSQSNIVQFNNSPQFNSAIHSDQRLTPTQLQQQLQYQYDQQKYQMQQQQQFHMQLQNQKIIQLQLEQAQSPLSAIANNRLFTHSRSASASPK